jgi:CheY-like chemotaxis protein
VVDDDLAVLRAYRRLLTPRHQVVLVSGGAEALERIERDGRFDAIICDVMMPEVDGPMVFDALTERHPAMVSRIIFCSGGAFTPRAKEFLASVSNPFIPKPIESDVLEQAIQEIGRLSE